MIKQYINENRMSLVQIQIWEIHVCISGLDYYFHTSTGPVFDSIWRLFS